MMARARLFVLACATEADGGMDNLPTVIAEAMAAALPVVSTRLAGVPEMVREGINGLLVEEKNPVALAEAMAEILRDPEKGRRFGAQGKVLAGECFSTGVCVGQLKELLNRYEPGEAVVAGAAEAARLGRLGRLIQWLARFGKAW